jgi:hypothetical protein
MVRPPPPPLWKVLCGRLLSEFLFSFPSFALTSEILISNPNNLTEVEQKSGTLVCQRHTSNKPRKYKGKIFLLLITHSVMTA